MQTSSNLITSYEYPVASKHLVRCLDLSGESNEVMAVFGCSFSTNCSLNQAASQLTWLVLMTILVGCLPFRHTSKMLL